MFDDFDKLIKCDVKLHNLAMIIKFIKNETFDEFYTRFSIIITSLNYIESHKIVILKRLITLKLHLQILNEITFTYNQYIKRLRRCDQNMRL